MAGISNDIVYELGLVPEMAVRVEAGDAATEALGRYEDIVAEAPRLDVPPAFTSKPKRHPYQVLLYYTAIMFSKSAYEVLTREFPDQIIGAAGRLNGADWYLIEPKIELDVLDFSRSALYLVGPIVVDLEVAKLKDHLPSAPTIFRLLVPSRTDEEPRRLKRLNSWYCNAAAAGILIRKEFRGLALKKKTE